MHPFLLKYFTFDPYYASVKLKALTDVPINIYCHWSTIGPKKNLAPIIRRGIPIFCYPTWSFISQHIILQNEPGDSLNHTYQFPTWPSCTTRWSLLSYQTDLKVKDSTSPIISYHNQWVWPPAPLLPLQNGSFEHWSAGIPDYWTPGGTGYIIQENTFSKAGDYALKMAGYGPSTFKILYQDIDAIPYRGKHITFRGWGNQQAPISGNRRFTLETNGTPPIYTHGTLPSGTAYGLVTLSGTVPMNATYIRINCIALNDAYYTIWSWYDELNLFLL